MWLGHDTSVRQHYKSEHWAPVASRHRRDMAEKLLKATLNPNKQQHGTCKQICKANMSQPMWKEYLPVSSVHSCQSLHSWHTHYMSHVMRKPTKWHVLPAKTQISLGIRPVWSGSSLSAWRKLGSLAAHWMHSEDSDQTGRIPRLIWVFTGRTGNFVGFVMRRLIWN